MTLLAKSLKFIYDYGFKFPIKKGLTQGIDASKSRWYGDFNTHGITDLLDELITPKFAKIGEALPSKKLFNKIPGTIQPTKQIMSIRPINIGHYMALLFLYKIHNLENNSKIHQC